MTPRNRHFVLGAAVAALIVIAAGLAGSYWLASTLRQQVVKALGPLGSAESIEVGLTSIRLKNVRLRASAGWPTADTFRADEVEIAPDLRALLSHRIRLRYVHVDHGYLSVLRSADGRMRLLPSLKQTLGQPDANAANGTNNPPEPLAIGQIRFSDSTLDFFDASVATPPPKVHITALRSTTGPLDFPTLGDQTQVDLAGTINGPTHNGSLALRGWIVLASKDSDITTTLQGVDVAALEPYLTKGTRTAVQSGTLDLNLHASVHDSVLHAPGILTLNHLELASGGGALGTFLAIPRETAIASLKDHHDQITLHFEVDGNLSDPHFSLNESLGSRLSIGFAQALGVSVEGVAKGTTGIVKGLGDAVKSLIGQ